MTDDTTNDPGPGPLTLLPEEPLLTLEQRRRVDLAKEARKILASAMPLVQSAVPAKEVIRLAEWLEGVETWQDRQPLLAVEGWPERPAWDGRVEYVSNGEYDDGPLKEPPHDDEPTITWSVRETKSGGRYEVIGSDDTAPAVVYADRAVAEAVAARWNGGGGE